MGPIERDITRKVEASLAAVRTQVDGKLAISQLQPLLLQLLPQVLEPLQITMCTTMTSQILQQVDSKLAALELQHRAPDRDDEDAQLALETRLAQLSSDMDRKLNACASQGEYLALVAALADVEAKTASKVDGSQIVAILSLALPDLLAEAQRSTIREVLDLVLPRIIALEGNGRQDEQDSDTEWEE